MNISASGALRQERRFQLISQNLSNVQTAGYKKDVPVFSTLFAHRLNFSENQKSEGSAISFQQGSIEKTGNILDLAIDGEGFFKVMTPNGIRYTRAGHFKLDREQRLTNANGFPVLGRNGEIRLNGKGMVVEKDGTVKMDGGEAGRIALVAFADSTRLRKEGNSLFVSEVPEGEREVDSASILQGYLEQSNVNSIEEMVTLIDALRTYEACLKMLQSRDELNGKVVNELGRV
jgi:flagellar basal-body rod protein FlgG